MGRGGADIDLDVCATPALCAAVKNYVGHHTSVLAGNGTGDSILASRAAEGSSRLCILRERGDVIISVRSSRDHR